MHATRSVEALARQPGRVVGGEENDRRRDLLRLAEACAERGRHNHSRSLRAGDEAAIAFRIRVARRDGVDADLLLPRDRFGRRARGASALRAWGRTGGARATPAFLVGGELQATRRSRSREALGNRGADALRRTSNDSGFPLRLFILLSIDE